MKSDHACMYYSSTHVVYLQAGPTNCTCQAKLYDNRPANMGLSTGSLTATTVVDARLLKAATLTLTHTKLSNVPQLVNLKSLTSLDLSANALSSVPVEQLPETLKELTLTGCHLAELPPAITRLTALQKLFAGANRLSEASVVFRCQNLQHAGLSYNQLSSLPAPALLTSSPIISLDLSHNCLADLTATVRQLSLLPALRSVNLQGNPFCLDPEYQATARKGLPALAYLDGQQVQSVSADCPASLAGRAAHTSGTGAAATGSLWGFSQENLPVTYLELCINDLHPAVDPYESTREMWESNLALAEVSGLQPVFHVPVPPLQPMSYYFELKDVNGVGLCGLPITIAAPLPPEPVVPQSPSKGTRGGAKAKPPSAKASKAKPAKGKGKVVEEEVVVPVADPLQPGGLKVVLPLYSDVQSRDWLRNGINITVHRLRREAILSDAPPPPPVEAKPTAKGKKGLEIVPEVKYDITEHIELLGTGCSQSGAILLDGCTTTSEEVLELRPVPQLFDHKGLRMPLKDERHHLETTATLRVRMTLHVPAPVMGPS